MFELHSINLIVAIVWKNRKDRKIVVENIYLFLIVI